MAHGLILLENFRTRCSHSHPAQIEKCQKQKQNVIERLVFKEKDFLFFFFLTISRFAREMEKPIILSLKENSTVPRYYSTNYTALHRLY